MPSKKKPQPSSSGTDTRPLSLEFVMRKNYEPPTRERPDKMGSFIGWNGFILDRWCPEQRLGFTRLNTEQNLEGMADDGARSPSVRTSDPLYKQALSIEAVEESEEASSGYRAATSPWNARYYSPAAALSATAIASEVSTRPGNPRVIGRKFPA